MGVCVEEGGRGACVLWMVGEVVYIGGWVVYCGGRAGCVWLEMGMGEVLF